MEKSLFTKGEPKEIMNRMDNVHTIEIYCPVKYYDINMLQYYLEMISPGYRTEENVWTGVPVSDVLRNFVVAYSACGNEDTSRLAIISGVLRSFKRLKYIDFKFVDNDDYDDVYNRKRFSKTDDETKIFKIKKLEFNLSDMFSQEIIDLFNKILMMDDIIFNDYLRRKFFIDFKYDEYISFVSMMISNNETSFDMMDENIRKYFTVFPEILIEQKPDIRVITNYAEL